jgi:hypothetical protein
MQRVRTALKKAAFVSSVKQYLFVTLDSELRVNVRTEYVVGSEDHAAAAQALETERKELRACSQCILDGKPGACQIEVVGEPCTCCKQKHTMGHRCVCAYFADVMDVCDQGSAQRKAMGILHVKSEETANEIDEEGLLPYLLASPRYQRPGHGMLHVAKNLLPRIFLGVGWCLMVANAMRHIETQRIAQRKFQTRIARNSTATRPWDIGG